MAQPYVKELLGSSEIVLIETRQHWMAAIRFALRPIVIALVGLGLLALNNIFAFNDDQFFSFINDLITWAVVILFLISIVWIPIDLIRWDSRRYVLTNRRSMRVDGVLQKNSIDSSLEQITDIGMHESTIGRLLGYADLTLYTASDAANEQYEQLLDGKQYKIAVLDAKEAIRHGGSMDELPEGFIVKGGTNEASMRADGKISDEDEAAETTAAPPDDQQPAAPPPAAAVAEQPAASPAVEEPTAVSAPEPAAEPEAVSAPEPEAEPEAVTAPEPIAEPALVVEPEPEPATTETEAPVAEPEGPEPAPAATEPEAPEPEPQAPEPEVVATEPEAETPDEPAAEEEPKAKDDGPTTV